MKENYQSGNSQKVASGVYLEGAWLSTYKRGIVLAQRRSSAGRGCTGLMPERQDRIIQPGAGCGPAGRDAQTRDGFPYFSFRPGRHHHVETIRKAEKVQLAG